MSVAPEQRYKPAHRCPICGGCERDPRGEGKRCIGYLSADGDFAHCSRAELAGEIRLSPGSETYGHRLFGPCACGQLHNALRIVPLTAPRNGSGNGHGAKIEARYDYRDEHGTLLYQVERLAGKQFRQRRPDGAQGWSYSLGDTPRVLYRLPELLATGKEVIVYIPEGEKDVDNLVAAGLVATCNPGGVGKWRSPYNGALMGRRVVILADKDEVGRTHAAAVHDALRGAAAAVVVVELAGAGKDVTDWLAAGNTAAQLDEIARTALGAAAGTTPIRTLADLMRLQLAPARFAVPGLLAEGCTLFCGRPKSGKSWLLLHLALAVAFGGRALGSIDVEAGEVLYLALEDGERLLQRRFGKLLAGVRPPAGFFVATEWPALDGGGLGALDTWLAAHPKARMVVLDTLARVRGRDRERDSAYRQDYEAIAPLTELAHRYGVAIVVVHHTRKSDAEDVMDTVSGTTGLTGAVDAMVVLTRKRFGVEATLSVTGRDIEEHELAMTWDSDAGLWSYAGEAEDVRQSQTQKSILEILAGTAEPVSPKEVGDACDLAYPVVKQRLWQMAQAGAIVRTGRGLYMLPNTRNLRNLRNLPEENEGTEGDGRNLHRNLFPQGENEDLERLRDQTEAVTFFGGVPPEENGAKVTEVTKVTTPSEHARAPCPGCGRRYTETRNEGASGFHCSRCGTGLPHVPI